MAAMRKFRVYAVAIALLSLVVAAAVVYGVVTHAEPTGLPACSGPGGKADYDGECFKVRWDHVPITVHLNNPKGWEAKAFKRAARGFNQDVGLELFVVVPDCTVGCTDFAPDVEVDFGSPFEAGRRSSGFVQHWLLPSGRYIRSAVVDIYSGVTVEAYAELAYKHELGHVAGLAHDDYQTSLMWGPEPLDMRKRHFLSDDDKAYLRCLYGGDCGD